MSSLSVLRFTVMYILYLICKSCDYYFEGPYKISDSTSIGNIFVGDIFEISFELLINSSCPNEFCSLLHIGDEWQSRLPLIAIYNVNDTYTGLHVPFSINTHFNQQYNVFNKYFRSIFMNGNYHKYYFKFTKSDRIIIFNNNITCTNITNGTFDSSNYVYRVYPLWITEKKNVNIAVVTNITGDTRQKNSHNQFWSVFIFLP